MKPNNATVALVCLTAIIIVAVVFEMEGAKEIALALGGAIGGWMSKGSDGGI